MRKVIYNKFFTVCITTVLVIFIFCLNSCQRSIGESDSKHDSSTNGIKVLFDTDIGGDVDDVGALVILNNYVNQGKVELLAVGVCAYNPYSPGVIDSVCQYYGNTDVRMDSVILMMNRLIMLTNNWIYTVSHCITIIITDFQLGTKNQNK